jgi:hypothetical protein
MFAFVSTLAQGSLEIRATLQGSTLVAGDTVSEVNITSHVRNWSLRNYPTHLKGRTSKKGRSALKHTT